MRSRDRHRVGLAPRGLPLVLSGLLLSACAGAGLPTETPTGPLHVTVSQTSHGTNQWPYFIAVHEGFYDDLSLEVEFVQTENTSSAIQGILAGSINVGGGSLDAFINAYVGGATDLIVVGTSVDRPNYPLVASPDISSFADLVGKRVGVSTVAATDGQWMRSILQDNGLDPDSDVEIVEIGGSGQRFQALLSGGISATFITQPLDFQAYDEGFVALGNSTDIVEEIIWESYSTTRTWAEANQDALVRFLAAQRRAHEWFYDAANRDRAVEILIEETNAERSEAEATYDLWVSEQVLAQSGVATTAAVEASIRQAEQEGQLDVEDILDGTYMDRAAELGRQSGALKPSDHSQKG